MTFLVYRSVPLSLVSREAIRSAGGVFIRRDRTPERIARLMASGRYEFLWNMGNTGLTLPEANNIFNPPSLIRTLISHTAMRELMGELMPPRTGDTEYVWEKRHGRGGRGKVRHRTDEIDLSALSYWEDEVIGTEYRLITVDGAIVQQFIRTGGNDARQYTWIRQRDLPSALKQTVRQAAGMWEPTVRRIIGWDTVVTEEGTPFIFEGNSSPGMSEPTVNRIVNFISTRNS